MLSANCEWHCVQVKEHVLYKTALGVDLTELCIKHHHLFRTPSSSPRTGQETLMAKQTPSRHQVDTSTNTHTCTTKHTHTRANAQTHTRAHTHTCARAHKHTHQFCSPYSGIHVPQGGIQCGPAEQEVLRVWRGGPHGAPAAARRAKLPHGAQASAWLASHCMACRPLHGSALQRSHVRCNHCCNQRPSAVQGAYGRSCAAFLAHLLPSHGLCLRILRRHQWDIHKSPICIGIRPAATRQLRHHLAACACVHVRLLTIVCMCKHECACVRE